jgi:hypothetical protein
MPPLLEISNRTNPACSRNWRVTALRASYGPPATNRAVDCLRRLPILFSVIASGLVVAACGSSGGAGTASPHYAQALKFSKCMRARGLAGFPDPSAGGGGIQIKIGSGLNPFSPAFKAAQAACYKLLPGGGPGAQHPTARVTAQVRQIAQCMRQHGVSDFPDPTFTPPSNPADYGILENRGGVILAVPRTINPSSPAFRQAAAACHFS